MSTTDCKEQILNLHMLLQSPHILPSPAYIYIPVHPSHKNGSMTPNVLRPAILTVLLSLSLSSALEEAQAEKLIFFFLPAPPPLFSFFFFFKSVFLFFAAIPLTSERVSLFATAVVLRYPDHNF